MKLSLNRNKNKHLANLLGYMPTASSEVDGDGQLWLATSPTELAIVSGNKVERIEWSDFANAAWDGVKRELVMVFIDPSLQNLRFVLIDEYSENFVTAVRERIDRSIVYQQFVELSSGVIARGQVRRNSDETLFTQIVVDGVVGEGDSSMLHDLEAELREAVGL
ncbi:hypothetical protein [Arcanobacterium ihumii]|uniref:hypothetical protein n=1 Tax=Arcanobacterium ihumii TaxID=2138162 RepID=UPI000F547FEE|nr:hypothetical protein [Arcanobacterium ihumii]